MLSPSPVRRTVFARHVGEGLEARPASARRSVGGSEVNRPGFGTTRYRSISARCHDYRSRWIDRRALCATCRLLRLTPPLLRRGAARTGLCTPRLLTMRLTAEVRHDPRSVHAGTPAPVARMPVVTGVPGGQWGSSLAAGRGTWVPRNRSASRLYAYRVSGLGKFSPHLPCICWSPC